MSAKVDELVSVDFARGTPDFRVPSVQLDISTRATATQTEASPSTSVWTPDRFAHEQLGGLIQRIFFPGVPKASRQVVITSADGEYDTSAVCARLAREMAETLPGTVCAIEADTSSTGLTQGFRREVIDSGGEVARLVNPNLWLANVLKTAAPSDGAGALWLRTRLSELRRQFDYSLIHAPVATSMQSVALAQIADGVILVVEARRTRRAVALKTLDTLKTAKVVVLGTILADRAFPIPEKIYRRL
jgi:Mrp family chromosome partitioning ATPase